MSLNSDQIQYWCKFLADHPEISEEGAVVSASMPGDKDMADQLIELYLQGRKKASSGLVKDYIFSGDPLPEVGNFWIVLDSAEKPRCILRTVKVITQSFDCVREDVAEAEGDGDCSLEYWQKMHREFFTPYLSKLGIKDLDPEEIMTEFFEVVFK